MLTGHCRYHDQVLQINILTRVCNVITKTRSLLDLSVDFRAH